VELAAAERFGWIALSNIGCPAPENLQGKTHMFTSVVQRWRNGRERYRPARETIATREYEITETQ